MRCLLPLLLIACACACACRAAKHDRGHAPVATTPRQLFAELTSPDADSLALVDKYRDGATFTGMLQTVGEDETGRPILMMAVDGKNIIALDFANPLQARGHREGESLTVTCKIGGASGALMMVTDCVL